MYGFELIAGVVLATLGYVFERRSSFWLGLLIIAVAAIVGMARD